MKKSLSVKKIGLMGPFGSGNLGDAAIQEAVIQNLRKYLVDVKIYGFSPNPADTTKRHSIESFPISRKNKRRVRFAEPRGQKLSVHLRIKATFTKSLILDALISRFLGTLEEIIFICKSYMVLKKIDVLIVSGGGQLDDYWGGAWGHPYTLFKWAIIAKLSRTKLVFLSVGADSLTSPLSKFFIKHSLLLADYRSYRDHNTLALIEKMGVGEKNMVYPDLAFSLETTMKENPPALDTTSPRVVGVSPISANAWTIASDSTYQNYMDQLVSVLRWLVQRGYSILFFPSQVKMDAPVITLIKEKLERLGLSDVESRIVECNVSTLDDLLEKISWVDLVIASRLHAVLLSLLLHKPTLAISYNKKVNLLTADMSLSEYCIDLSNMNADFAIELLKKLVSNNDVIANQIANTVTSYRKSLQDQYINLLRMLA